MFQILNPLKGLKIDDVLFNLYRMERIFLMNIINVDRFIFQYLTMYMYLSLYNRYFTRLVRSFSLYVYFPVIH